ncbi:MAG TPA: hypothetical protein VGC22_04710 [Chitinophaga sp.]
MPFFPPFVRFCYRCLLLAGLLFAQQASAQTDTVSPRHTHLQTNWLRPGARQYLVYFQRPGSPHALYMSLWLRTVQKDGPVFRIRQHWYSGDSARYVESASVNNAADFSPVYHSETTSEGRKGYNWSPQRISGDTAMDNKAAGFTLAFRFPSYNWNLDIETFEMLPLAEGKTFAIPFYDAGHEPPAYVMYKVTGSDGDCWKLFTEGDYPMGHFTQTFWITKTGHELVKEEDTMPGLFRYKVKLPAVAPDILPRFATK